MRSEIIGAIAFIILSLAVVFQSSLYPLGSTLRRLGPGAFPLITGSLMGLLSIIILVRSIHYSEKENKTTPKRWSSMVIVVGAILAYAYLLSYLGFFLTTFLFSFSFFKYGYPNKWLLPLGGALGTASFAMLIFRIWLGTPFPQGIWGF